MEQLDPSPWLWAAQGEHPRLFEACQAPITSEVWAKPGLRNLLPCEAVMECGDEHRVIFAVAPMATEMVLGPSNDKGAPFKPWTL